jgi:hypothetical protein
MEVVIDYSPREQFRAFHDRGERFAAIVAHRRAGKTVACVHDINRAALSTTKKSARFAYVAPFYAQAKDVAWNYAKEAAAPVPGVTFNESELRIDYPNGARVRLYGADNYDRMRGIYLDGVVLDEYGDMDPRAWVEVIRPALADRKGWAVFIGTPKGENAFYEVCERAKASDDWFHMRLKASETGLIDAEELAAARAEMSEDQYRQEFECAFDAAVVGAYYAKLLTEADDFGRVANVPHDPALPVYTAWDLGIGDSTAIWFAQFAGPELRLIDCYEASGVGLDHYASVLRAEGRARYNYADHFLPHDAWARELGTGRTREEVLRALGLPVLKAPQLSVDDGINAARMILPRCYFDRNKCADGLRALRHYRAEFDEKRKVLRPRPLHDWSSHYADAFRYLAVSYRERFGVPDTVRQRYMRDRRQRQSSAWAF